MYIREIYIPKKLDSMAWLNFIKCISAILGSMNIWHLYVVKENNILRYFIKCKRPLPTTINNLSQFLFEKKDELTLPSSDYTLPYFSALGKNLIDIINLLEIKDKGDFKYLEVSVLNLNNEKILKDINVYVQKDDTIYKYKTFLTSISSLLNINYEENKRYVVKSIPKYLDISKIVSMLSTDSSASFLKVTTFPYLQGDFFLKLTNYDFNKHSIIFGSSGCGKSKFISSFISSIYNNPHLKNEYRFVVIDPHASLEDDIGYFAKTIDFKTESDSIDLFKGPSGDLVSTTEMYLDLFKSLILDGYNPKLERVLRHAIYLLLANSTFNFPCLKKLLIDLEYRNNLIKNSYNMPESIINFFLTDFNELRTKSYTEAISPIISFIDEMMIMPVFNLENNLSILKDNIENNFLTLFSLDMTALGLKITKTIAGLIMQMVMQIIQARCLNKHIIFIVDEVATIQSPILERFLSEARKYNLSLVLAGQYFSQIKKELQEAIFANVNNYYIFKLSKNDADILVKNINIKIPLENTDEKKVEMITELPNRSLIARISYQGKMMPAFMAQTLDFKGKPRIKVLNISENNIPKEKNSVNNNFKIDTSISLNNILKDISTGRKVVNK